MANLLLSDRAGHRYSGGGVMGRSRGERVDAPDIQLMLRDWRAGVLDGRNELIAQLYPELARIAAARLRREQDVSLSTEDLINDAVLQLVQLQRISIADKAHFIALASRMMRHILIDHARSRASSKRSHRKVELSTRLEDAPPQRVDLNLLHAALMRLRALDEQLMQLVEMRYFGGMTTADIAEVMGISEPTVKRRWQVARAWLADAMANPIDS